MLVSSFNVQLGDLGSARLMAPKYVISGKASSKADVSNFGVVTLEMLMSTKARDFRSNEMGLVERVWGQKKPLAAMDQRLHMEFDEKQAKCMVMVGFWRAHPDYTMRPSIRQAIQVLNFEAEMPGLPLQIPVPMYYVPPASPPENSIAPLICHSVYEMGR